MVNIYGTLGPACADSATLEAMIASGMTGVRLNVSHTSLVQEEAAIEALHEAAARQSVAVELLADLQGPELRVGAMEEPLALATGDTVSLDALRLPEMLHDAVASGAQLLLDDGKILVEATSGGRAQVLRGGVLTSRKSVACPDASVQLPALTEADHATIAHAASYGVTGVMQPFVRGRDDLDAVRAALDAAAKHNAAGPHARPLRLFAKIENTAGVDALPDLLPAADEFVIARGDLGNAMPLWELPAVQKRVAATCRAAHKPFMVVTQMLASMEQNLVPTRAEVSDVFNAIVDGASSVMVTGETAVGKHPVEVITYLANTVRAAQAYLASQA